MSIATDLDHFVSGKGSELCDAIAAQLGLEEPIEGWDSTVTDAVEEELKDQLHNDSEAMFTDWMNNHGAYACKGAFTDNYEAPEDLDNED
jgi:hypothetical protein